jgi:maleamate amidohydrolase
MGIFSERIRILPKRQRIRSAEAHGSFKRNGEHPLKQLSTSVNGKLLSTVQFRSEPFWVAMERTKETRTSARASGDRIAILLIEFQRTWTDRGIFHALIKRQYRSRQVYAHTRKLLQEARAKGIPILQAPLVLDKGDRTRYQKAPLPARLFKRFQKGTWKAEFTEGIYEPSDIVVQGRSSYDASIDSDLLEKLEEQQVGTVYVGGFTTDHCVKATVVSLRKKGFNCAMVSDCTAAITSKLQKKTEAELPIVSSETLIARFQADQGKTLRAS